MTLQLKDGFECLYLSHVSFRDLTLFFIPFNYTVFLSSQINHIKIMRAYFTLSFLCLLLYLPGIASLPIVDRDSPHFAQASLQMVESKNYVQINFQDKPRHLKPPGIYWLHAIVLKIAGNQYLRSIWAYRIPGVIGALLAVLFTYAFAKSFYSVREAWYAASILACSLFLVIETRLIITDTVLLLTMVLMQGALWKMYTQPKQSVLNNWRWPLLFWFAMALGVLIKGLTPLIAGLTIIGLSIFDKDRTWLKNLKFSWGLPLLIVLTLAWLIPVSVVANSNLLFDMVGRDLFPKIASGQESHGMPPGYFITTLPLMFWPVSLFIWHGLIFGIQNRCQRVEKFLLIWIGSVLLFYEIIVTKLPQYILPIYPAIAILAAIGVSKLDWQTLLKSWRIWLRTYSVLWLLYSAALIAGVLFYFFFYQLGIRSFWLYFVSVLMIIGNLSAFILFNRKEWFRALNVLLITAILVYAPIWQFILPQAKPLWLSQQVYEQLQKNNELSAISEQRPLLAVGYEEPSLVFLIGTKKVVFSSIEQAAKSLYTYNGEIVLIAEPEWIELNKDIKIQTKPIAIIKGFNLGNGTWTTLYLLHA
ncbi:MAG: ArnT family glycosyltransferase [Gammaproteobacteria bacterium]